MPLAHPGRLIACSLIAAIAAPAPAWGQGNGAAPEQVYECWMAMDFAVKQGERVVISPQAPRSQFDAMTKRDPALRKQAQNAVNKTWADYRKQEGRASLNRYILGVAQDCVELYGGNTRPQQATVAADEGQIGPLGTLSAGALRAYMQRTGDAPAVADYLVYHYPYGKDLFKPNADGDYLSELIVQTGANGLRDWSDEAVYAVANKSYWQYNPPATRLIFAEYQRRMRKLRMDEAQARAMAQRAADDRAQQARSANARPVGSLGNGNRSATPGTGIVTCTTYSGYAGGTACREEK